MPMVLREAQDRGHRLFTRPYELNLVAVRSPQSMPDRFDDALHVLWKTDTAVWAHRTMACTTDPGLYYLREPMNVKGTAVVAPGQYLHSHRLGKHRGRYTALVQRGPVTVWRDPNRDAHIDRDLEAETGLFGINIHRANAHHRSTRVGKWSAGCIVVADPRDFHDSLIGPARRHHAVVGPHFTLTVLEVGWVS